MTTKEFILKKQLIIAIAWFGVLNFCFLLLHVVACWKGIIEGVISFSGFIVPFILIQILGLASGLFVIYMRGKPDRRMK